MVFLNHSLRFENHLQNEPEVFDKKMFNFKVPSVTILVHFSFIPILRKTQMEDCVAHYVNRNF